MAQQTEWVVPTITGIVQTSWGRIQLQKDKPIEVPKGEVSHTGAVPYRTTQVKKPQTETRKAQVKKTE